MFGEKEILKQWQEESITESAIKDLAIHKTETQPNNKEVNLHQYKSMLFGLYSKHNIVK